MSADWRPLFSIGDVESFFIVRNRFIFRGGFEFFCLLALRDGTTLPMQYRDMDDIAAFLDEFGADDVGFPEDDAVLLEAELDTARRRLRGELH